MAPPPRSAARDAFPRNTYAKYKRATVCFLSWLLRARHGGLHTTNSDATPLSLDVYEQIVTAIATDPTMLSPSLLQRLPHALDACQTAITLRTRVALFFGDAADDTHAHFLARLQRWFQTLRRAVTERVEPRRDATAQAPKPRTDFANYYEVLALPDDFFSVDDDAASCASELSASSPPLVSKADRKQLQDEAFADDFSTELACMFMELDELSEAVYAAFLDVKRETKTLVEATVVAKVAIDCAVSIIANMQLRHPGMLRDGRDLLTLMHDRLSLNQTARLVSNVRAAWQPSEDPAEVRHQYVPGTILVDMAGIIALLVSMAPHVSAQLLAPGVRYDEATTRNFVVPEWGQPPPFFLHHVPHLLNMCAVMFEQDVAVASVSLEMWLLDPFRKFIKTGAVTMHLVFVCVCWIRSVAALQGNRSLARTASASLLHLWDLEHRLGVSMVTNRGRGLFHEDKAKLHKKIQVVDLVSTNVRVNPLLAGCVLLDQQLHYLWLGNDLLQLSLFRPLGHIYAALRDRRLVDEIPFLEDALDVYEAAVFTPSRAAAVRGSFARSYLASHNLVAASVTLRLHKRAHALGPSQAKSMLEKGRMSSLSGAVRLLEENDFSMLPDASSVSWTSLLAAVSDLVTNELFDSRVLSRDALHLSDSMADVFESLCEALDGRARAEKLVAKGAPRLRALENVVVFTLLPMLDALADDDVTRSHGPSLELCRRTAAVLMRTFGDTAQVERAYFTFPSTPAWVSTMFPTLRPTSSSVSADVEFASLLKVLKTSRGPLRGEQLESFKRRVIATPSVLAMMVSPEQKAELWSLLHEAAAGPARDLLLTEWLVQMGALVYEPPFYRYPQLLEGVVLPAGYAVDTMPNMLAVHCTAKRRDKKMVQVLLEADNFWNLDTTTLHTKESIVHLAVQNDDRALFMWLTHRGAKTWGTDAAGRHLWDVTSDRKWKAQLKHGVARDLTINERKTRDVDAFLECLRSPAEMEIAIMNAQRGAGAAGIVKRGSYQETISTMSHAPQEPVSATLPTNSHAAIGTSKKKKTKKKKNRTLAGDSKARPTHDVSSATHFMEQLFLADDSGGHDADKIRELSAALERLEAGAGASVYHDAREECASRVLAIYRHFADAVHNVVPTVSPSATVRNTVQAAARAVVLLTSFQQRLGSGGGEDDSGVAAVAAVHALVTPADDPQFQHLFQTMMKVATLARLCGLTQLANEMTTLMETRLLSIHERLLGFREMVYHYIMAQKLGNLRHRTAVTVAVPPQLVWYASDHGAPGGDELHRMDRLYGCRYYLRLAIAGGFEHPACVPCLRRIDETIPHGRDAVFVSDCIIAGADSREQLHDIRECVLSAAKETGLVLRDGDDDLMSIEIVGFEFSASGILPVGEI